MKRYSVILAALFALTLSTGVQAVDEKLSATEIINKHSDASFRFNEL